MFHSNRIWCVADVETPEELAEKLTEQTWTLCAGFRLGNCVFLNDSLSEDGAQEYAVLVNEDGVLYQVESITFGWCSRESALKHIRAALAGEFGSVMKQKVDSRVLQSPEEHGRCELCA